MAVSNAHEAGDQLELEVKLVAAAGVCPTYGRRSVDLKERPLVRARSTPRWRPTCLCWAQTALPLPRLRAELQVAPPSFRPGSGSPSLPAAPPRAGALRRACR